MSIYDDILAELKITNEEIQLIRMTLERIDQRAIHLPPLRGQCNAVGCDKSSTIMVGYNAYCVDHARGT